MPKIDCQARLGLSPWYRMCRWWLAMAGRPRLTEGPLSVLLWLLWLPWPLLVLVGAIVEMTLVTVLFPIAWAGRAMGLGWRVDVRTHGMRLAIIRTRDYDTAWRIRDALRTHFRRHSSLDGAGRLLAGVRVEPMEISRARWERAQRAMSPYGRRRWFLWRRRMSFRDGLEALPDGAGDDLLSMIIAIPFMVVFALLFSGALVELLAELVLLPFVLILKLCHLLPWPIDLVRPGAEPEAQSEVYGLIASVRARRELTGAHALRLPVPRAWAQPVVSTPSETHQ